MYYDLHVHSTLSIGENSVEEMAAMAKRLGLSGIGIVSYDSTAGFAKPSIENIDIVLSVMLKPAKADELGSMAQAVRDKSEILMVHGGDYDINRAACESSMIDMLCHPELGRHDSGIDHICAKAAAENNIAIEINFREILESYRKQRMHVLSSMRKNIELCKKYGAGIIVSSGAVNMWGMRCGRELAAASHILGLELGDAIASASSVPESIVRKNRQTIASGQEGVKIIGDSGEA